MSEPRYLVRTPQGDMGPYTAEQIQAFVAQNQLPPDAQVIDTRVVTAAQIAGQPAPAQPPQAPAPVSLAPVPPPQPQLQPPQPPAPPQVNAVPGVVLSPDLEAGFAAAGGGPVPAPPPAPAPMPGAGVHPVPAAPPPQQFGGNQVEIAPSPELAPPPNAPVQPGTSGSGLRAAPGPAGGSAGRRTGTRRHTNRQTGRTSRGGGGTDAPARGSQRGGARRGRQTDSRSRHDTGDMDDFEPLNDERRSSGMAPGLIAAIVIGTVVLIGGGVVAALTLGGGDEQLRLSELQGEWHIDLAALESMPWFRKVGEFEKRDLIDRYTTETFAFPDSATVVVYAGGEERWRAAVDPRSVGPQRLRLQITGDTDAPYRSIDLSRRDGGIVLDRAGRKTPLTRGPAEALQTARAAATPPPSSTSEDGTAGTDADATASADPADPGQASPADAAGTEHVDAGAEGSTTTEQDTASDETPPEGAAGAEDGTTAPPRGGPKVSGSTAAAEEAMAAIAGDWHADEDVFMASHYTRLLAQLRQRSEDPRSAPREASKLITRLFATLYRFSDGTYTESIGDTVKVQLTIEGASTRPDDNGWILYTEQDQPMEVIPTTDADSLILRFLPGSVYENGMDIPLAKGPPPPENVEAASP